MDEQVILAVDESGQFSGEYIPKSVGHTGKGRRHLAITVLLYNSQGEVLLQRRKHKVFDNIWDFTASTHPLHTSKGDETLINATLRALKEEYGIENVELKDMGSFNYFAKIDGLCENEHDHILVGEYNGEFKLNPEVGYEYKWVAKKEFLRDFENNPKKYAPWVSGGMDILKKMFF